MKILLDENLSPTLVQELGELGIAAQHIAHLGKSGLSDLALWRYAYEHDQVVVTINAADFLHLAAASSLHAGLIILRAQGLTREEQWEWIRSTTPRRPPRRACARMRPAAPSAGSPRSPPQPGRS